MAARLPVVAVTLGDPAGIGPELVARLLSSTDAAAHAEVVLVGDPWLWADGQRVAGVDVETAPIRAFRDVRGRGPCAVPAFLPMDTVPRTEVCRGVPQAAGGRSVLAVLDACIDAAQRREVDAICFAPLNKLAMKQGGLRHEDELHHFAEHMGVRSYFCEFNTLGELWTARVSSHIPLREAAAYVTRDRIKEATRLIDRSLKAAGVPKPKVLVAAFNPHAGEGGTCGREEVEVIAPAVEELAAEGIAVNGPYPADTIFLKAHEGACHAIVTMYHDQGQIALKLLGFSRGVTVQGGLPVPLTTPAHGTAYDIAGQGRADVTATYNAFRIAARMGASALAAA